MTGRERPSAVERSGTAITTSVIVPCRDPGPALAMLLESLAVQRCTFGWEVVLVDNGTQDGSILACRAFSSRLHLRIVRSTAKANASYARNHGVRVARGSKILFIDADDQVGPGYVQVLSDALDRHPFVTSRVDSASLNPPWTREAHGPPWQESQLATFFGFLPGTGSNVGVTRELLAAAGPLPEEFDAAEDIAFSWRVRLRLGIEPLLVHEAVYRYRYRNTLAGLFRQARRWGESHALLYKVFRHDGMPGRSPRMAHREWRKTAVDLWRAHDRKELASVLVRAGSILGRILGSLRHRVLYV